MAAGKGNSVKTFAPRPPAEEREFLISRVFDASRDLVWKAWTDPKHMARWWGPKAFTNPVCEMDVRPGGAHRIVMRGADGVEYPLKGVYREVAAPERLVKAGGIFHYGMRSPDGHEMWGRFVYREITAPETLVFVVSFSDEMGGVTRHPLSADWPLEVLNTLLLAENEGRTTLTLRGVPVNATEAERKAFEAGRPSM
jgi:uncharacterized protein YndB with AHSA1/START domain